MAAQQHESSDPSPALAPASTAFRLRIGMVVLSVNVLAVILVAGGAPAALRAPVVLLAGSFVSGYALVARLPVNAPTLLALDVCASLALESAGSFLMVQTRSWHPGAFGLALAVVSGAFALATVQRLRAELTLGRV